MRLLHNSAFLLQQITSPNSDDTQESQVRVRFLPL